jgi:hypothetical protein
MVNLPDVRLLSYVLDIVVASYKICALESGTQIVVKCLALAYVPCLQMLTKITHMIASTILEPATPCTRFVGVLFNRLGGDHSAE